MSDSPKVLVFPLHRRRTLVEETANICARKAAPAAGRFWQLTMRRLLGELQANGITDDGIIDRELRQFADAVLDRMQEENREGFPDEAA